MTPHEPGPSGIEAERALVRNLALANLLLIVRDQARLSRGRFEVDAMPDALLLRFHDVVTLVAQGGTFGVEPRDFTLIVVCPPLWPFDREAALQPIVVSPMDFRHSNSDSHRFCLDLRGISPERLPELLYDNLRLKNRRLDHVVDAEAAAYIRAHLAGRPADPRPLYPEEETR